MSSFEKMPRQENAPESDAVKQIENGTLPDEQLRTLATLKAKALRYGVGLYFYDTDEQTGKMMNVKENLERQERTIKLWEQRFQAVAKEEALKKLSAEERQEYEELIRMSPEQREASGEGWRDPSTMLDVPDVRTMAMEDLQDIIDIYDLEVAEIEVTRDLGGWHSENEERYVGETDEKMTAVQEIMADIMHASRDFREAIALQMERPGVISASLDGGSEEYLKKVKEKLGI